MPDQEGTITVAQRAITVRSSKRRYLCRIWYGGTHGGDGDGREPEEKELVYPRKEYSPDYAQSPCTERAHRNGWIIGIGDSGSHLRVRRVII